MDDVSLKFLGTSLLSLHLYMYFTKPFDQRAAKETVRLPKLLEHNWLYWKLPENLQRSFTIFRRSPKLSPIPLVLRQAKTLLLLLVSGQVLSRFAFDDELTLGTTAA